MAIDVVGAVARDVNARDVGLHLGAGSGLEIPALVHFQWRSEWAGVGDMADGNEDARFVRPVLQVLCKKTWYVEKRNYGTDSLRR